MQKCGWLQLELVLKQGISSVSSTADDGKQSKVKISENSEGRHPHIATISVTKQEETMALNRAKRT
jgi:hypothetical protein